MERTLLESPHLACPGIAVSICVSQHAAFAPHHLPCISRPSADSCCQLKIRLHSHLHVSCKSLSYSAKSWPSVHKFSCEFWCPSPAICPHAAIFVQHADMCRLCSHSFAYRPPHAQYCTHASHCPCTLGPCLMHICPGVDQDCSAGLTTGAVQISPTAGLTPLEQVPSQVRTRSLVVAHVLCPLHAKHTVTQWPSGDLNVILFVTAKPHHARKRQCY